MSKFSNDPLLGIARTLLVFLMAISILIITAMGVAAVAIFVAHDQVAAELVAHQGEQLSTTFFVALAIVLGLIGLMAGIGFRWLRTLKAIVDSVGEGDPFIPENADRLSLMGWLTLAIEGIGVVVGGMGQWLAHQVEDATSDFGLSLGGILLAITLFILARVFRRGAEMRAELEGTV